MLGWGMGQVEMGTQGQCSLDRPGVSWTVLHGAAHPLPPLLVSAGPGRGSRVARATYRLLCAGRLLTG